MWISKSTLICLLVQSLIPSSPFSLACDKYLTPLKQAVGMPFSFVLELHSYWHLLTGLAAFFAITGASSESLSPSSVSLASRLALPSFLPSTASPRHLPLDQGASSRLPH